jgi:3-isopropylmalate dehydrogenase
MAMRWVVLPGDGIGPEISAATVKVLERASELFDLDLTLESHDVGLAALGREGTTAPEAALRACRAADAIVLGPLSHLEYPARAEGGINLSAELRVSLDLFANVRPSRSREGVRHFSRTPMDLVIVRENTEGFYADRNMHSGGGELMPTADLALAIRKVSAGACRRIAVAAFELARHRRRSVTAVHKANVLRVTEGLFLREMRRVAEAFDDVAYGEQLVDSMAALLVREAARFDVVVTTNMFGDILSDEAAELAGGIGLAGSINVGESRGMAQAQHGSAPDIAGLDRANPCALIASAAMLLAWLGARAPRGERLASAAAAIEAAIDALVADPARRTVDLGGRLGTRAFTDALCAEIGQRLG